MIPNLIQNNQPLSFLASFILFVITFLWIMQYLFLKYGNNILTYSMIGWGVFKQYFGLKEKLINLSVNYPMLYHILWQRLNTQHFYGRPLTALLLITAYVLALFVGLVEDVVTADSIVAIDHLISQHMAELGLSAITDVFILITSLGSTAITGLVISLTGILCWIVGQRYLIIGLLIAAFGSMTFTYLSKLLFRRDRPSYILLFEPTYSFPSGHAAVALALYGFVAYLAIRFSSTFSRQVRIATLAIFVCVMIGLSRIVLNEHYLSDVLGGYLVGMLWLTVAMSVTEWLTTKDKINWQIRGSNFQMSLVWISIITVLIGAVLYANIFQFPLLY